MRRPRSRCRADRRRRSRRNPRGRANPVDCPVPGGSWPPRLDSPAPRAASHCAISRGDPALPIPSRSSSRHRRSVGIEARCAIQIEASQEPGDPRCLRPQPRRLERDRPGRGIARPDVVPALALAGDHRPAPRVGQRDEDADRAPVEPARPARGVRSERSQFPPQARRREGPCRDDAEVRSRKRRLDRLRRLLGGTRDGGGDEDRDDARDDARPHGANASLCAFPAR